MYYSHNGVLRNKFGLSDPAELDLAEKIITTEKSIQLQRQKIDKFDTRKYLNLHRSLFGDIYTWAGEFRKVELSKGGTRFFPATYLEQGCDMIFTNLGLDNNYKKLSKEAFCKKAAHLFSNLNDLHAFREGNGRTNRLVLFHVAKNAGWYLDLSKCDRKKYLEASIAGCNGNDKLMEDLMLDVIQKWPSGRGSRGVLKELTFSPEEELKTEKEAEVFVKPKPPIEVVPRKRRSRGLEMF